MSTENAIKKIYIELGSVVSIRMRLFYRETELSLGTGFFYEKDSQFFLITNWHNMTGRDPGTGQPLSKHGGVPDRVKLALSREGNPLQWTEVEFPLYQDAGTTEHPQQPLWLEHPTHRNKVDVVVMPITIPKGAAAYSAHRLSETPEMRISVASDVFVLGYPKGISGGGAFPIWKRASIASEPDIDLDGLPKLLIDTATREGMSGSPVVAMSPGGYVTESGGLALGVRGARFIGIYSGRLGKDEMQAQLGIVWKTAIIDEIIDGREIGKTSFS